MPTLILDETPWLKLRFLVSFRELLSIRPLQDVDVRTVRGGRHGRVVLGCEATGPFAELQLLTGHPALGSLAARSQVLIERIDLRPPRRIELFLGDKWSGRPAQGRTAVICSLGQRLKGLLGGGRADQDRAGFTAGRGDRAISTCRAFGDPPAIGAPPAAFPVPCVAREKGRES